jgi:hypothetical protein
VILRFLFDQAYALQDVGDVVDSSLLYRELLGGLGGGKEHPMSDDSKGNEGSCLVARTLFKSIEPSGAVRTSVMNFLVRSPSELSKRVTGLPSLSSFDCFRDRLRAFASWLLPAFLLPYD